MNTQYPVIINGEISEWNILYECDSTLSVHGHLNIFKSDKLIDSTLLISLDLKDLDIKKGTNSLNISSHWKSLQDRKLKRIIQFTNDFPPGQYIAIVEMNNNKFTSYWKVDSLITTSSEVHNAIKTEISGTLKKTKKKKEKYKTLLKSIQNGEVSSIRKKQLEEKVDNNISKSVQRKFPGIKIIPQLKNGKQQMAFYYEGEYIGYSEYDIKEEIKDFANRKTNALKEKINQKSKTEFSSYRTLFEQYKEEKIEKSKKDGVEGTISIDNYFDSDQEEYSPQQQYLLGSLRHYKIEVFRHPH